MYAILALLLVTTFTLVALGVPFRWVSLPLTIRRGLRELTLCSANQAVFETRQETAQMTLLYVRLWFAVAVVTFAILSVLDGTLAYNRPQSVARVTFFGLTACIVSTVIVYSVLAYTRLARGLRDNMTLSRCGFRRVWIMHPSGRVPDLRATLIDKVRRSRYIRLIDVTGYEMFVKAPNQAAGFLTDVLSANPDVPITVLLLNPTSRRPAPDRSQATLVDAIVRELGLEQGSYLRRVRRTLEVIARLNCERSDEGRIDVRLYDDQPITRALISEDSMFVIPWSPTVFNSEVPCIELCRQSDVVSLFETFRRDFSRLQRGTRPAGSVRCLKPVDDYS